MTELITPPVTIPVPPVRPARELSEEERHRYMNPWMRLFARAVDFTLATQVFLLIISVFPISHLFFLFLSPFGPSLMTTLLFLTILLLNLLPICLWCLFVEPYLLSRYGHTPGKYLFNLRVTTLTGELPTKEVAYTRSWQVWFYGFGIGIPLVSSISSLIAYIHLKKYGATTWDNLKTVVIHEKCGWIRKTIIFLLFVLPIILFVFLALLASFALSSHLGKH